MRVDNRLAAQDDDTDITGVPLPNFRAPHAPTALSPLDLVSNAYRGSVPPMGTPSGGGSAVPLPSNNPVLGMNIPQNPPPNNPQNQSVLSTPQNTEVPMPGPQTPPDMGLNPTYRRGLVSQLEHGDDKDMEDSSKSKVGMGPIGQAAGQAAQDYLKTTQKKVPWWQEAIGTVLSSIGVPQAGNKMTKEGQERSAYDKAAALEGLAAEERRGEYERENLDTLKEQRLSLAESRRVNAEARKQNADVNAAKLAEIGDKEREATIFRTVFGGSKARQDNSHYQSQGDPISENYKFSPNPNESGMGWMVPNAMWPVPPEYRALRPGIKETPYTDYLKMLDDYSKVNLEKVKAENKPDRPVPNKSDTQLYVDAQSTDPTVNGPAKAALAQKQKDKLTVSQAGAGKPITMIVPNEQGGQTLQQIRPGQDVPAGAMTPSGVNTVNTPTSQTRTMAEVAPKVLNLSSRIKSLLDENEGQLGPLSSRWQEYTAGKIGLPNKGYTQLRTNVALLQTALMRMHVGSRGGEQMMGHFKNLLDQSIQSPENLRAALGEIDEYAKQVQHSGGIQGMGTQTPNNQPSVRTWNPKTQSFE